MDRLQAYDSTSSASEESDNELDPHQGEILKKSKRKITEIEGNFAHLKAEVVKQPEVKRPRILDRSLESRDATLHDELSRRTPNNVSVHKYLKNNTPAKCEAGFLDSVCDHASVQNCKDNKASVPYSTRIVHQPSSRSVGRSIKPYIPKREREKEGAITATLCAQTNISEVECGSKFKEVTSKPNNDVSNNRKTNLTCRPPKKLHLELQSHSQGVNCVRWNPTKSSLLLSVSMDHVVCIWDTQGGGACVRRLTGHTEAVKDSKWSLCGEKVLSCGYDKTARLTELQTGQEIQKFSNKDYVTCVQFHPTNPSVFLAGTFKSAILCWDTRTGNVESKYTACFGQVQDLAFLPGGEEFISAAEVIRRNSTDKGIMVWDFRSTAVLSNQIYQEAFTCTSLRVHPHESHFVAQSNGDYIALFSTRKPYKLNKFKRYQGHKVSGYHIGCDFSPDGSIVCSGSADGNMFFYNHHTSQVIKTLDAHTAPCMDIAYHPSLPSCVASCGWDGQVKVWT